MEQLQFADIIIIFGLGVAVIYACHRLKVPAIVGFLITGILAGPHGLQLVTAVDEVDSLANLGVIFLLFSLGIEMSFRNVKGMSGAFLIGGSLQVSGTIVATAGIAVLVGLPLNEALFVGFLVSMSSTAIVLKVLHEKNLSDSPAARTALSMLVFQDVAVVILMLMTPVLAGSHGGAPAELLALLGRGVAVAVASVVAAVWIVPKVLYGIASLRNRELFLLTIVVIALGVAWTTAQLGLSPALGAFLAGLIISESSFSQHALGSITPFRDVLISFFFVSVGMLIDLNFVFQNPVLIASTAALVMVVKFVVSMGSVLVLRQPARSAVFVGLSMAQIGEFSFVLASTGIAVGLLERNVYQIFLGVSAVTILASPFLITAAPAISAVLSRTRFLRRMSGEEKFALPPVLMADHIIIAGYGPNGRHLAGAATAAGIPYAVVDMNPMTVLAESEKGVPIHFGDTTQPEALVHAGIARARILVVVINDPAATRSTVQLGRQMNPGIHIIARTRFISEIDALTELGANEAIPEEFETSVEILARVLSRYLMPRDEIEKFIGHIRGSGYSMLRSISQQATTFSDIRAAHSSLTVASLRVTESLSCTGKKCGDIALRNKYGVTLLAIKRPSGTVVIPGPDEMLNEGDILVVLGEVEKIEYMTKTFTGTA
ncbi:MAG: cation:proton antiporter [Candidatus Brocadiia bacterium]